MPEIRLLPTHLINKIAAGEVIERPASVVKELLENSIDSEAKSLVLKLRKGGRNLIAVQDDGCGMTKEQLSLALQKHATSKIQNNIDDIQYLGFRGEALPSIAAISKLVIDSYNTAGEPWRIETEGGVIKNSKPSNISIGTSIEVSNLFYSTPNRIKFLKSEKSENAAVLSLVNRMAICYPDVSFTVFIDDKKVLYYETLNSLDILDRCEARIQSIRGLGKSFMQNCKYGSVSDGVNKIDGYVGMPTYNTCGMKYIYMFVNNRPVHDQVLIKAIRFAYQDLIPRGRCPYVVLRLDIPNESVDVNVHPTKAEVRFLNERAIFNLVVKLIKESISESAGKVHNNKNFINMMAKKQDKLPNPFESTHNKGEAKINNELLAIDDINKRANEQLFSYNSPKDLPQLNDQKKANFFSLGSVNSTNNTSPSSGSISNADASINTSPSSGSISNADASINTSSSSGSISNAGASIHTSVSNKSIIAHNTQSSNDSSPKIIKQEELSDVDKEYPLGNAKCQIGSMYIIAENSDGIVIVDQHAAHERIVYEEIKVHLNKDGIKIQASLSAEFVEFDQESIEVLQENKQLILELGVMFDVVGDSAVLVQGIPAFLNSSESKGIMQELVNDLLDTGVASSLMYRLHEHYGNQACYNSIRAGRNMNMEEMNYLLRKVETIPNAGQCNHGRSTYIKISRNEIHKMFERL